MKINSTILILFIVTLLKGQEITPITFDFEYQQLIERLENEDWTNAESLTNKLLEFVEKQDSFETEKKVLRYIYIYSIAGVLNDNVISKEEALNKTIHLKGKEMIMPSHPFNSKSRINSTAISDEDSNTFFSGVNNKDGTNIFAFEYVKIKNGIKHKAKQLEGKLITLSGTLKEISIEGQMFPRFKLRFENGEYFIHE